MKKFYILLFFVVGFVNIYCQTPMTLTFIGKDSLTQNLISLDSVYVKNLTENCDTSLYGDVCVLPLIALWPVGVNEINENLLGAFVLKQNYPNPFQGSTIVSIYREYGGIMNLMIFDGLGSKLAEYHNEFEKGFNSFMISSSENKVLFLSVFDDRNNRSIKIISAGQGNLNNSIQYLGHNPDVEKYNLKGLNSSGFIFYLGNQLMYTAYSNGFNDKTIIDSPTTTTTYTFLMAPTGTQPTVTTVAVTNITQTTATSGGNVTSDGGYPVLTRGVCWSTSPNPTIANSYTVDGSGLGVFVSNLAGLAPATTYYIRAYATNGLGTAYGNELTFITLQNTNLPTVTTVAVTNITQTTATSGGNVISDGGATVTARGVCWSTSPSPTIANSHTIDGSGLGSFISYLTGLTPNTTYYVCAYATNSVGTAYGNENSFTTGQTITPPTVTTATVINITQTTATSGGTVTSDGGATVTARGVCWSTTSGPTTTGNHTTDGTGTGTFVSNLTGLTGGTLYYIRAYATNSTGTSYGNELTFTTLTLPTVSTNTITNITQTTATSGGNVTSDGGATVTARGVCWSTSSGPTTSGSHTTDGSGTGSFVSNITGLTGGTLYYVRAYATNSVGTAYGSELTFTTLSFPTVTTTAITNITQTTATSGGNVTTDGGATVTARGVCWSTSANPTTSGSHTTDGTGTGTFISNITGLTGGTLYYVRAYATNNVGTAYGSELTFTTQSLPTVTTTAVTNITQTTATSGGNVTSDGGATVTARGVCWSTSANPTTANSHTTDGTGTGTFVSNLTGLITNTLYYLRAYATNGLGTGYGNEVSFTTLLGVTCGSTITINHVAGSVAPVTKTVTYGTVTNIPGETSKCWITSNLGADHQATAVNDATEASAGWYWQFNRKQGYKHDGTTRTPNTTWITSINENMDWYTTNDPCLIELGSGWRIPTNTELTNLDAAGNWTDWNGPWNSGLKMHAAGYLNNSDGSLNSRGTFGAYWGSVQYSASGGWYLVFDNVTSYTSNNFKTYGFTLRCVNTDYYSCPAVTTAAITIITQTSAISGGNVTSDGGVPVTARGVCWSTSASPTTSGSHTTDGSGVGTFVSNITGLTGGTLYHVRAYATNSLGTAYGSELTFTTLTFPTVTTNTVTNITQTTATSGGNVTSDGGATVTARGVCWSTSANPTTANSHTTDGTGTGTFVSNITGLTGGTLYHVRAYATNSVGTSYGSDLTFTTLNLPTVITAAVTNITSTTATSGGNVTSDGGATVTARGVCWSTSSNPNTANSKTIDGSGTGTFVSGLTGLSTVTLYYVRAYATNSVGTAYGNEVSFTTLCGSTITINHVAGSVAPVTKTVTYGTVTNIPGETSKCWITSNLGADHQATAVNDATEASAGWYWQFNRKQGYKHDGTTRTPNTTWITPIDENSDWQSTNDPCALELGNNWRLPTKTEWSNIDASGSWSNCNDAWNSPLKLHKAGWLSDVNGSLNNRGTNGVYWSGNQDVTTKGWDLYFDNSSCYLVNHLKAQGFTVRCIK